MTQPHALAVLALSAITAATASPSPAGEIASLTFPPRPTGVISTHYIVPLCTAAVAQVQASVRTGEDTPLSAQYLMDRIGASDGPGGDITALHGFTSPLLGWQYLHDIGTCPASLCPPLTFRTTQAMDAAAANYRCGASFIPANYAEAVGYIAEHPGACLLVSTYGYEGYAVIQADDGGNAVWLDYNQHTGEPELLLLDVDAGDVLFRSMVEGQPYPPSNYSLVVETR